MRQEVYEADAIEEASVPLDGDPHVSVRSLPVVREARNVALSNAEVRTLALAAAGGLVAGAATVAVVRAVAGASKTTRSSKRRRGERPANVVASRSFLVDVHLLGDR